MIVKIQTVFNKAAMDGLNVDLNQIRKPTIQELAAFGRSKHAYYSTQILVLEQGGAQFLLSLCTDAGLWQEYDMIAYDRPSSPTKDGEMVGWVLYRDLERVGFQEWGFDSPLSRDVARKKLWLDAGYEKEWPPVQWWGAKSAANTASPRPATEPPALSKEGQL